jgi:hypothetical protein
VCRAGATGFKAYFVAGLSGSGRGLRGGALPGGHRRDHRRADGRGADRGEAHRATKWH